MLRRVQSWTQALLVRLGLQALLLGLLPRARPAGGRRQVAGDDVAGDDVAVCCNCHCLVNHV